MFQVKIFMENASYEYLMPDVPREGDTVLLFDQRRRVTRVEWDLESGRPNVRINVYLGERR